MIELTDIDRAEISAYLTTHPDQLFQIPEVRAIVGRRRYLEMAANIKHTDLHTSVALDALEINEQGLRQFSAVARVDRLTKPLLAIDRVFFNAGSLSALCVGPRTEMELMALMGIGFKDVRGLDLFSYSPLVDVGNMHAMPYEDDRFDVVIGGWILVYSTDPAQACREIARVCKPGGIIAIGATYWPEWKQKAEGNGRGPDSYPSSEQVLAMFKAGHIYTRHDAESQMHDGRTIVIFENVK